MARAVVEAWARVGETPVVPIPLTALGNLFAFALRPATGAARTLIGQTDLEENQRLPAALGAVGTIPKVNADRSALEYAVDEAGSGGGGGGVTVQTTFAVPATWVSSVVIDYLNPFDLYYIRDTRSHDRLYAALWTPTTSASRMLIPVLPDGSSLEVYVPNAGPFANTLRVRAFNGAGLAQATAINIYVPS